jgi:hypothetical protein
MRPFWTASVQIRIFCHENPAHAALTQIFDDLIVRDGLADHGESPTGNERTVI